MARVWPSSDPIAPSEFQSAADDRLRQPKNITYEISSGSEDELAASSTGESSFSSPEQPQKHRMSLVDLVEDDDDDEVEEIEAPPPRGTAAGHSLRQREHLKQSLRAQNHAEPTRKKQKLLGRASTFLKAEKSFGRQKPNSERMDVREKIATETTGKRANFFVAKKQLFLPLLPNDTNHIKKLVLQRDQKGPDSGDLTVPYEILEKQPEGVKATMKPYQLLGLSFLVYMHRNGLSGILGDEMGLGKTLQTLSLIQYLKVEHRTSTSSQLRPSLVICPLSVLSSWMAESKKWTPGLKVVRFHGPAHERNRLKQVVAGEIDQYGNKTRRAALKHNARRAAKGQDIIDLEAEDEEMDERGVDIVVTTYDGFLAEQSWFKRVFVWNYVVLDEGHRIKNDSTLISKALQGLGAEYRLILTGTPLQNNLVELWALLHWLYPEVFTDRTTELFKTSFDLTKGKVDTEVMDHARRLLEVIMLRRMKNSPGVELNLPPKTDVLLYVPLTPMQRFFYRTLLTRSDEGLLTDLFSGAADKESALLSSTNSQALGDQAIGKLESLEKEAAEGSATAAAEWEETREIMRQALSREQAGEKTKGSWQKLMNILMQLRKCCNHPYTLPNTEPDPYYIGDHVIKASGKFILMDKLLNELVLKQKKKVLIFSGFARMLDCCEDFLALRGGGGDEFNYVRLDGRTSRARRNLNIRMFNDEASDYRVMLISTRAGGLGINLATASDVIMLDFDWNPQVMLQAEARSHRIGQKHPVTVYKLCTQGTVEEQMMGRIQKKLYLSAKVTESMRDIHLGSAAKTKKGPGGRVTETDDDVPQLGTSELMSLVRRGAQTLAHPELDVNEMMGWDFSTMLEKCKDNPADHLVAEQTGVSSKEEDEKKWLAQVEQVQSRLFEGKKHMKVADVNSYGGIAQEWAKESRRVGKNTTVMVDGFAISKESMNCGDWEAVPTMAGKDPSLAEPRRAKKAKIENQSHCQVCWDGGNLVLCSLCPRSYHYECMDKDAKARSKSKINFSCPQHECHDCAQKTSDAGGMLFRCRWCERSFCEDCLDWDKTKLLGDNLKEYELLGFSAIDQAWYIKCPNCTEDHINSPDDLALCEGAAKEIDEHYEKFLAERASAAAEEDQRRKSLNIVSLDECLTDATTVETSGATTPGFNGSETPFALDGRKHNVVQKSLPESLEIDSRRSSGIKSDAFAGRKRKAAPESFINGDQSPASSSIVSDGSTKTTGRKLKTAKQSSTMSPTKRSKRRTA